MNERLVDQTGDNGVDRLAGELTNSRGRLKIKSSRKHRKSSEGGLLLDLQQPVTPVKGCCERLLAIEPPALSLSKQAESVPKPLSELVDREMGQASGGKLKSERYTVKPMTDLGYGTSCICVQFECGRGEPGAFDE
jgi:hypothetical protein